MQAFSYSFLKLVEKGYLVNVGGGNGGDSREISSGVVEFACVRP